MTEPAFRTIKIRTTTYERLQKLLARVSQKGWAAIGSQRESPATIADLVDEGLAKLESKPKQ